MKIAPALCDVVLLGHSAYPEDEQMTEAAKELLALLAVEKAARASSERYLRMWRRNQNGVEDRLVRALTRLAPVSGSKRR